MKFCTFVLKKILNKLVVLFFSNFVFFHENKLYFRDTFAFWCKNGGKNVENEKKQIVQIVCYVFLDILPYKPWNLIETSMKNRADEQPMSRGKYCISNMEARARPVLFFMVDHTRQIQVLLEVLCFGVKYSLHSSLAFSSSHSILAFSLRPLLGVYAKAKLSLGWMPRTNAQGKEHSSQCQCTKHTLKLAAVVHHNF